MAGKSGTAQAPLDLEGKALVTGRGQYTDDMAQRDALVGVFVRSSIAHGIIRGIDTEAARAAPGVVGVLTGEDLAAAGCNPITFMVPLFEVDGRTEVPYVRTPRPPLARDRIRHIGEALALVVAETPGAAQDAADLVDADIEELPPFMAAEVAGEPPDTPIWEATPTNRSYTWLAGDHAGVKSALSRAAHTVSVSLRNQRVAGSPLEPRAAIASYDAASGRYTLHAGSQGTTFLRKGLADALGVPPESVRVVSKDVGGGFGLKVYAYPEYVAVAVASRLLGRTVRWTSTRSEALMADQAGRDSTLEITGAFDDHGHVTAISCDIVSNIGAYAIGIGPRLQSSVISENIAGPYLTPEIAIRSIGVHTNSIPTSPYRGAGRPETTYMLERLMDRAARQIGIDPIELRRRNLIPRDRIPYTGPMNQVYDSGDFAAVLEEAVQRADWKGFEHRREEARKNGFVRGIGCSLFTETAGANFMEPLDFRVTEEGIVELRVTGVSTGQRHASTITHIVGERLGIGHERIRFIAGDSDEVPAGSPAVGSRVGQMTGSAALQAAENAIARGRMIVGAIGEGRYNDISYSDGCYTIAGTGERIAFLDIPERVAALKAEGKQIDATLDAVEVFKSPGFSFPNGCHVCEVEIDPQTGRLEIVRYTAVDDCGTVINHPVVEGQLIGGIAQGLGQALMEEVVYDEAGQLLTGSFMDYAMPRAEDMPRSMTIVDLPDPTPSNPLGAKGVGESGTTGSVAAIVSAVEDALRPLGVTEVQMPLTPGRIWEAIRAAKS
ncbi:xanthine dehydrogenase family protein molybdopterin-binding subunit [Neorhizobium sp. DT-125]|uniref:xanthine dehydrogenase family protein molybdopterin-binding subunit n=1 Tax=Neorhizobium sp. DT-125 TaxID=3396163 RepID=UPI003F1A4D85